MGGGGGGGRFPGTMGAGDGGGRFPGTIGAGGAFEGGTLYAAAKAGIATDAGGGSGGRGTAEWTFVQAVAVGVSNIMPSGKKFANDLCGAVTSASFLGLKASIEHILPRWINI